MGLFCLVRGVNKPSRAKHGCFWIQLDFWQVYLSLFKYLTSFDTLWVKSSLSKIYDVWAGFVFGSLYFWVVLESNECFCLICTRFIYHQKIFPILNKFNVTSIVLTNWVELSIFLNLNTLSSSFEPNQIKHSLIQTLIIIHWVIYFESNIFLSTKLTRINSSRRMWANIFSFFTREKKMGEEYFLLITLPYSYHK